jgi:3-hydroxyacyl-CoA dehydrogenase
MNPVPVMKLVEVIPGLATSDETLKRTLSLAHAMGVCSLHFKFLVVGSIRFSGIVW